ncbi:MAG: alanine racemase [Hyphomonas sp.]|uniref:alanine racemase n=1 Tax=Hyphomonas sp. TaxID=87 RepID=UPI003529C1AC
MYMLPRATIHLGNIADNWRTLDRLHPGASTAAVIKANAYGLGAAQVAKALVKAGCDTFFVAYVREGMEVRKAVGNGPRIFVLSGPNTGDLNTYKFYQEAHLTAVLSTAIQLHMWNDAGSLPCALHFDTGMNRLGLKADMIPGNAAGMQRYAPVLVMSHLACADEPDHPFNEVQRKTFDTFADRFPDTPASLSNSAGCFLGSAYAYDLTRPGIALYGGSAPPPGVTLKHAVTLEAKIISTFTAKAGETVGYGATHTLKQDTTLATVGLGYADGMLRTGSGKLMGWVDGVACPVVGRISMDLITLDVTNARDAAREGSSVEFLGPNAKLEEQAARAGTLGYELLTGMGSRVQRVYK